MKKLEFETSKGRFLVVDMVIDIWTSEDEKSSALYLEGEVYQVTSCVKLSEMTEEEASGIVDYFTEYSKQYQDYERLECAYLTAIESLLSLLKSKGIHLFKNPYVSKINPLEYKEAKQKTFHNPYIFKL